MAALDAISRRRDGLALLGAACIALGYFRTASWETAFYFARDMKEEIWLVWSPVEALAAVLLVAGAILLARRGAIPRAAGDGLLLGVGIVVLAAMAAFVGTWFDFDGTSQLTGFGAVVIAVAGLIGLVASPALEAELPRRSLLIAGAGVVLGLAPLVVDIASWDDSSLVGYAGGALYVETLVAGVAAILALLALVWVPRGRLPAAGVLAAVGVLLAIHLVAIFAEIGSDAGLRHIRYGGVLGIGGGLLLVIAAARIVRAARPVRPLAVSQVQPV